MPEFRRALFELLPPCDATRFGAAEHFVREHLVRWLEQGLPAGTLLNINIPSGSPDDVKGIRPCRLGSRRYTDVVVRKEDPRGRAYYWIAGEHHTVSGEPDTDLAVVDVERTDLQPATFQKALPAVGELAVAMGSPLRLSTRSRVLWCTSE